MKSMKIEEDLMQSLWLKCSHEIERSYSANYIFQWNLQPQ